MPIDQPAAHAPRYHGIFPVVPTTFTETGELDLPSQKRAIDFMIDAGSDGLCILATTCGAIFANHIQGIFNLAAHPKSPNRRHQHGLRGLKRQIASRNCWASVADERRNARQQLGHRLLIHRLIAGNGRISLNIDSIRTLLVVSQNLHTLIPSRLFEYLLNLEGNGLLLLGHHLGLLLRHHLLFR